MFKMTNIQLAPFIIFLRSTSPLLGTYSFARLSSCAPMRAIAKSIALHHISATLHGIISSSLLPFTNTMGSELALPFPPVSAALQMLGFSPHINSYRLPQGVRFATRIHRATVQSTYRQLYPFSSCRPLYGIPCALAPS